MDRVPKLVKLFTLFLVAGFFNLGHALAQDTEVSDDKLKAYIMVMDSVDVLRADLSENVSNMIVEHELMDGGRAYNTIKSAQGDTVKLSEAGITEEQIAAYDELQKELSDLQTALNDSFSKMVKEHVGIGEYNQIRKGLRSDAELKERYDALAAEAEAAEEDTDAGVEQDTSVATDEDGSEN